MEQESPQSGYQGAYVEVDGIRVHYLHAGTGKPMLLIHGLVNSSANWLSNIDALAQNASVYAIDLINMGKSQRIEGLDPGLRATARRIAAIMDALGIAEADIVGHSHGGAVALMMAARYPKRVRRLILFAPANPYNRSSDSMVRVYSTRWGRSLARLLPYLPTPVQRIALGEMYGGSARVADRCLNEIVDGLRSPATLSHVLGIIRCWFVEMARLRRVLRRIAHVPTLLIWGESDHTISLVSGIRLHRRLRGSALVVVPGVGHSVFEDAPQEANRIMLEWLASHPLPAPLPAVVPAAAPARRRIRAHSAPVAPGPRTASAMRRLSPEET